MKKQRYELKPLFVERMRKILGDETEEYLKIVNEELPNSIRCNTLKISPNELKKRLENKGWKIKQPFSSYPEIMIIENQLLPGEIGRSYEHLLGYYYVQEISSMLSSIALNPKPEEIVLDLCASPGSKTTQMAAKMENSGTIIANEVDLGRVKILASNTERLGVMNAILTRKDGIALCNRIGKLGYEFDKILVDAPCSGEGTLRSSPKTALVWNINTVKKLSWIQKGLFTSAFEILKVGGEMVYSTCTHSPEENEAVVDFALKKFGDSIEVEKVKLPVRSREGMVEWEGEKYDERVKLCARIYPQDNNTEGFFVSKFRRVK